MTDVQLIVKAGAGVISSILVLLTVTHNIPVDIASIIQGVLVGILGVTSANDHNTAK